MRVPGGVLALLIAACILCTACGCLDASPPPSGGGITPVDLTGSPGASTLSEALAELDLLRVEGGLNINVTSVHYVSGNGVAPDGRAGSWVLGIRDGDEVRWLTFGIMSWQEILIQAPLPDDEVNMTEILTPEDLLSAQEGTIRPTMERLGVDTVDIVLTGEIYSVTVRSNVGMETFVFRADTGEVVA